MTINFISSKDSDETRSMHTQSNNIEIMMGNETIEELFESYLQKYEEEVEKKMLNLFLIVLICCIIIFIK